LKNRTTRHWCRPQKPVGTVYRLGWQHRNCRSDEMEIYIALFRGINVGGRNVLPMKELVAILKNLGSQIVKTYIQSGNAVFQSKNQNALLLSNEIGSKIKKLHGFEPYVLLLKLEDIERAINENPFPEAETDPKTLHIGFLASAPGNPDLKTLETLKKGSERFYLTDDVFYLHAPEGVGRSKLAANVEKLLGVPMTDRNWKTVCKIREMARELNQ
jgi:uncharacterized protein (DUF1697 family)